jgi:hypothetical protein
MTQNLKSKIVHVGRITAQGKSPCYLLLRQESPTSYVWYELLDNGQQGPTPVGGTSTVEALQKARRHWRLRAFRTVGCGFRYTLPERDEHGKNALFYQMVASYATPNGVYFDEEVGHPCFVNFASLEARELWDRLKRADLSPPR